LISTAGYAAVARDGRPAPGEERRGSAEATEQEEVVDAVQKGRIRHPEAVKAFVSAVGDAEHFFDRERGGAERKDDGQAPFDAAPAGNGEEGGGGGACEGRRGHEMEGVHAARFGRSGGPAVDTGNRDGDWRFATGGVAIWRKIAGPTGSVETSYEDL